MSWIKKMWKKYMAGAKANDFPIKDYGVLPSPKKAKEIHESLHPDSCKVKDIDSALDFIAKRHIGLDGLIGAVGFAKTDESSAIARSHHGIGRTLRNELGLWQENELTKFFNNLDIEHADDMSGILLTCFHRKLNGKDFALDGQIEEYKKFWKEQGEEE